MPIRLFPVRPTDVPDLVRKWVETHDDDLELIKAHYTSDVGTHVQVNDVTKWKQGKADAKEADAKEEQASIEQASIEQVDDLLWTLASEAYKQAGHLPPPNGTDKYNQAATEQYRKEALAYFESMNTGASIEQASIEQASI